MGGGPDPNLIQLKGSLKKKTSVPLISCLDLEEISYLGTFFFKITVGRYGQSG